MDHLQSLKVTDLRAILAKANVRAPPRKNEMMAKIQADPDVYRVYAALYPQHQPPPDQPQPDPEPPKVQDEAEKRRLRAQRFGIPLVAQPLDEPGKLASRAARFGTAQKRPAVAGNVDAEEEERRRRRAERFKASAS